MSQRPLPVPWRKSPRNTPSPESGSTSQHEKKKVLDPWTILEHLCSTNDSEVREYCVQQLYGVNNWEEVDYFLPQLCSILLSLDWNHSHSLRLFLLRKCIDSLHFSLRTYWFLHACSEYCRKDQKIKCEKLWQQVEITVVNSTLPRSALENHPLSSENTKPVVGSTKLSSNEMEQSELPMQMRSSGKVDQERHLLQPSPCYTPCPSNKINDPEINVLSLTPEIPRETFALAKFIEKKDENQIATTEQRLEKNEMEYKELEKSDRDAFLRKQRRCAFFNAQLDLVHFLEGVAGALKPHKPEFRREVLRKNLEHANSVLPSGLYFPIGLRSSEPHSSILRIIPESNVVLDSKDKVPFLFHYEVRLNDYPRFSNRICDQFQDDSNPALPSIAMIEENIHTTDSKGITESPLGKLHASPRIPRLRASSSGEDTLPNSVVMGSPALSPQSARIKEKEMERDREMGKKMKKIIISEEATGLRQKKRERIKSVKNKKRVSITKWKRKIKSPFPTPWHKTVQKYKAQSALFPRVGEKRWMAEGLIFKAGDDLRQEALAMQFICLFQSIFEDANLPIKLSPFTIQVTSPFSGFVEVVKNSVSLSNLKMKVDGYTTLAAFWEDYFGPRSSKGYKIAIRNFVESLAGYSLVCYFLQVKDRHNGNILLDSSGRICHIDYGFMLSNSPGGNMGFESSPFKFQEDFITLLGGEEQDSEHYSYFQLLMIRGFLEARKHVRKFCLLARIMFRGSDMGCFANGEQTILDLRDRFLPDASHDQVITKVMDLIEESSCNWRTTQYDSLQRITNGIL